MAFKLCQWGILGIFFKAFHVFLPGLEVDLAAARLLDFMLRIALLDLLECKASRACVVWASAIQYCHRKSRQIRCCT